MKKETLRVLQKKLLPSHHSYEKLHFYAFKWNQHFSKVLCIPFILFETKMIFFSSSKRSAWLMCLQAGFLFASPFGRLELSFQFFALLVATCSKRPRCLATNTKCSSICVLNWVERCTTFRQFAFCLGNLCWAPLFLSSWILLVNPVSLSNSIKHDSCIIPRGYYSVEKTTSTHLLNVRIMLEM